MPFDPDLVQFTEYELEVGEKFQTLFEAIKDGIDPGDISVLDELRDVVSFILSEGVDVKEVVERLHTLSALFLRNNLDDFFDGDN